MDASFRDSRLTELVADYSHATDFSALPPDAVESAQCVVLDTLGSIVLGSTMTPGRLLARFVRSIGGNEQATLVGAGSKGPAAYAALANGTSAHTAELDPSHISWGHPAAIAVPAALAVTELSDLSGPEFINGVVLIHDVAARLFSALGGRQAVLDARHQHSSAMYVVGVAAGAGRLLHLDVMQLRYAMALATYNISSSQAFMGERRHMTKALTHGQSAYGGVVGAQLAALGFESNDSIIETVDGVFDIWGSPQADSSVVTDRLGEYYSVTGTAFKYYAAGYPIHAGLDGTISLMRARSLKADDIVAIRIGMSTQAADVVDSRNTSSISLQDMLSVGVVLGRLGYDDAHDDDLLRREDVRRIRRLITVVRDPEIDATTPTTRAAWVEIDTADGGTVKSPLQMPPGHWERGGMPWPDVVEKFNSLVEPRLGVDVAAQIVAGVEALPSASSIRPLAALLQGPPATAEA